MIKYFRLSLPPSKIFNPIAYAKYTAWAKCQDLDLESAMLGYITALTDFANDKDKNYKALLDNIDFPIENPSSKEKQAAKPDPAKKKITI